MKTNGTRRSQRYTRDQRKGVDFKIRQNEIGKYSTAGIDVSNVPEGYLDKFTEEEIEKAKELKAKQWALYNEDPANRTQPEYTDSFYLDYAKSLTQQYILGRMREIHKNRAGQYEINDMYWAQYSYEEIIQMENDGYHIPQHVLEWAHAQQQSDITDYIVLTDSNEADDASSTTDATSSDQLSKYRAQALDDIARIEKAEEETTQQAEAYRDAEKQAKSIQKHKEDTYKEEFAKINDMTKEWKELNDKQQAGEKLTKKEEKRLKQLSGLLNGENGKITTKIEADASDLDDFLLSMNLLNEKIDKNNTIVTETVQNATALTEIERQFAPSKLPFVNKGIRIDGTGPSLSTLYGIRVEDIADTAIRKSNDLNELSVKTVNHLSSDKSENLINFATEFSEEAHELNQNTKDTMGDKFGEESPDNMDKQDKYMVLPIYSAPNSIIATATTLMAEADMFSVQKLTEKQQKEVNKQAKKADKDVKDLEQEANTSAAEHEQNLSEEEKFLLELEQLNADNSGNSNAPTVSKETNSTAQMAQAAVQMSEEQDKEESEENEETQAAENTQETPKRRILKQLVFKGNDEEQAEDKTSKKTSILEKINGVADKDGKIATRIGKLAQKGINANSKALGLVNMLGNVTDNFEESRKTAQKVSTVTMSVGIGTVLLGHGHILEGVALTTEGSLLQSSMNPFTVAYGKKLVHEGAIMTGLGVAEIMTGTIAAGTGAEGIATTAAAKAVTTTAKLTEKVTAKTIEANQNLIATSERAVGIEPTNNNIQVSSGESSQQSGQPQQPAEGGQEVPVIPQQSENLSPEIPQENQLNDTPVIASAATGAAANTEMLSVNDNAADDVWADEEDDDNSIVTRATGTDENSYLAGIDEETDETQDEETSENENSEDESSTVVVRDNGSTQMVAASTASTKTEQADNEEKQEDANNKSDDKGDDGQQKSREPYSVEKEYSIPGSLKAMATTITASQDVTVSKVSAKLKESSFLSKMLNMNQINKNIEKNKALAEAAAQQQVNKAAQVNSQIETENLKIQEASEQGNEDELRAAQANVKTLQAQAQAAASSEPSAKYAANINGLNQSIKVVQGEQAGLKTDLNDFNKKVNELRDVSQDTVSVGAGTFGMGLEHEALGIGIYVGGSALVSSAGVNFAQMALGLSMMLTGTVLMDLGALEEYTGLGAAATGTSGLVLHSVMNGDKSDIDSTEKLGKNFLSMTRSALSGHTKAAQEVQKMQMQTAENVSVMAASASANVDTGNIVETDDKVEKKLVRFNKETELLSRKKRKKVNAVSASSRG